MPYTIIELKEQIRILRQLAGIDIRMMTAQEVYNAGKEVHVVDPKGYKFTHLPPLYDTVQDRQSAIDKGYRYLDLGIGGDAIGVIDEWIKVHTRNGKYTPPPMPEEVKTTPPQDVKPGTLTKVIDNVTYRGEMLEGDGLVQFVKLTSPGKLTSSGKDWIFVIPFF